VSWAGHLGGAVVGFFTSGIVGAARPGREWQRWAAVGAVVSILLICVGGLYLQMGRSERWNFLRLQVDTVNRFKYFQQFQQEWTNVHRYKVDTIDRNVGMSARCAGDYPPPVRRHDDKRVFPSTSKRTYRASMS
jgi:hypothetical protein